MVRRKRRHLNKENIYFFQCVYYFFPVFYVYTLDVFSPSSCIVVRTKKVKWGCYIKHGILDPS